MLTTLQCSGVVRGTCKNIKVFKKNQYLLEDTERLVMRLNYSRLGQEIPDFATDCQLRPPPPEVLHRLASTSSSSPARSSSSSSQNTWPNPALSTAAPSSTANAGVVFCPNGCLTKGVGKDKVRKPMRGNTACLKEYCKSCCADARATALANGTAYPACAAHGFHTSVLPNVPEPSQRQEAPTVSAQPPPPPRPTQMPINTSVPVNALGPSQPTQQMPVYNSTQNVQRRNLARPVDPLFLRPLHDARAETAAASSVKVQRQEIDALQKHQVELHIYFQVGSKCTTQTHFIDIIL